MELDQHAFYKLLLKDFPFTPTQKQDILLQQLSAFLFEPKNNSIYVLKGYAGTGKTTVIGAIVKK